MLLGGGNVNSLTALSSTQLLNKLVSTFFIYFRYTEAHLQKASTSAAASWTKTLLPKRLMLLPEAGSAGAADPAALRLFWSALKFTFRGMEKSQRMHLCLLKKPSFTNPPQQTARSKSSGALQTLRSAGKRCLCFTAQPDTLSRCCHCLHSDGFVILLQHSLEEIILLLILGCL